MTKTAWPFTAAATAPGKRATTINEWGRLIRSVLWGGVLPGELNGLEVSASGADMETDVATGRAIVQGFGFESTAIEPQTHAAADGANDRIDRVVLRLDWSSESIDLAVLEGTPAGSPSAPALTQTFGTTWEISLAQVLINAGDTSIDPGDVTDERDFVTQIGGGSPADGDGLAYDATTGLFLPGAVGGLALIAEETLASPASGITLADIPQTYRHLLCIFRGRGTRAATTEECIIQFNGDGGTTNYGRQLLTSAAATTTSSEDTSDNGIRGWHIPGANAVNNANGAHAIFVPNYRDVNGRWRQVHLSGGYALGQSSGNLVISELRGWWYSTAAITQMSIIRANNDLAAGAIATLYGMKAGA